MLGRNEVQTWFLGEANQELALTAGICSLTWGTRSGHFSIDLEPWCKECVSYFKHFVSSYAILSLSRSRHVLHGEEPTLLHHPISHMKPRRNHLPTTFPCPWLPSVQNAIKQRQCMRHEIERQANRRKSQSHFNQPYTTHIVYYTPTNVHQIQLSSRKESFYVAYVAATAWF